MVKIIDTRDSGKTRKLLTAAGEDGNALVVCAHPHRVTDKCNAYKIPVVEAIGFDEFIKAYISKDARIEGKNIYIDEIEEFVSTFVKLGGYSLSLD